MTGKLHGMLPILVTPLNDKEQVDYEDVSKLMDFYMNHHVDGVTVLAEVSESEYLTASERREILSLVVKKTGGKFPVITGIVRPSLYETLDAAHEAISLGASALLLPPPKNPKASDETIISYYESVDRESSVPIVILDNPSLGYAVIRSDLIRTIFEKTRNVRYLKLEDQPTIPKLDAVRNLLGNKIGIFGASHGRNILYELEHGVDGIMTSVPLPGIMSSIISAFNSGEKEAARELFYYSLPLAFFLPERTVAVKKELLRLQGIIKTSVVRRPQPGFDQKYASALKEMLEWTIKRSEKIM